MDYDEFYNRVLCDFAFGMYLPTVFEALTALGVCVRLTRGFHSHFSTVRTIE